MKRKDYRKAVKRKQTRNDILFALIFVAVFWAMVFFGLRAKAAEARTIRDGVHTAEYIEPVEISDTLTDEELDLFAALVMAEAGDQDYIGKCLVADVVLNRVDSGAFPNTITEVIYQRGQFSPVTDGGLARGYATVTSDCYEAVMQELTGQRIDSRILYFSMYGCANGEFVYQHGDHYFGV